VNRSQYLLGLTVAGLDPSGGAGITADVLRFAREGVHPLAVVSALTTQDTRGVRRVDPVEPRLVRRQIRTLADDLPVGAAKTGLLPSAAHVDAVADALPPGVALVVDPVLASSGGYRFLDARGVRRLKSRLLPRATLVTPNLGEAEELTGLPVRSLEERKRAAEAIRRLGARAVLIKGGHGREDPVVDLLLDERGFVPMRARRRRGSVHGTGCALSASIAALLARGLTLREAVAGARRRLARDLAGARRLGAGRPLLGWRLDRLALRSDK
jgi:hydroxymethylpyrimidine/phosphomethylpyrimidine kinase